MNNNSKYILASALSFLLNFANTQAINWGSLQDTHRHIVNASIGGEFGLVYGLSYGYHIKTKYFNIVPNIEYSAPSGKKLLDDFKSKTGLQIRWFEYNNFRFSTRVQGVFRRYENNFVRILNFGSDMAGVIGYYRKNWFVGGEVGFDKAIVTHFKHKRTYNEQFPGVENGWYEPATGGNFYTGLQTGFSFKRHDFYIRAGILKNQDFKSSPSLPYYGQFGYNVKL